MIQVGRGSAMGDREKWCGWAEAVMWVARGCHANVMDRDSNTWKYHFYGFNINLKKSVSSEKAFSDAPFYFIDIERVRKHAL